MSKAGRKQRSFKNIDLRDLKRLARIAKRDRINFFKEYPNWEKAFSKRVICIALCQGAAQHYVDNKTGINDFDVYTFFEKSPDKKWYAKRIKSYDFGSVKFGKSIDKPNYVGRRVDCMAREIEIDKEKNFIIALRKYLQDGRTKTARCLSKKSVILLEPMCGYIIWGKSIKQSIKVV